MSLKGHYGPWRPLLLDLDIQDVAQSGWKMYIQVTSLISMTKSLMAQEVAFQLRVSRGLVRIGGEGVKAEKHPT